MGAGSLPAGLFAFSGLNEGKGHRFMPTPAPPTPDTAAVIPAVPATPSPTIRVIVPPDVAALLTRTPEDAGLGYGLEDAEDAALAAEATAPLVTPPPPLAPTPPPIAPPLAIPPPPVAPTRRALDPSMTRDLREADGLAQQVVDSLDQARTRSVAEPPVPGAMTDPEWEKFLADSKRELSEALGKAKLNEEDDFAKTATAAVGTAAEHIFAKLRLYDQRRVEAERVHRWQIRLTTQEEQTKDAFPDYLAVLQDSGVWEGIPDIQGQVKNVELAKRIYGQKNPPRSAYLLGLSILAKRAGKSTEEFLAERTALAPPAAALSVPVVEPPAAPAPPARSETPAEALRRGQTETLERLAENSNRPRGLRGLTPAGEPEPLYTVAGLTRLMDINPKGYLALMDANPGLDRWHMSGGLDIP